MKTLRYLYRSGLWTVLLTAALLMIAILAKNETLLAVSYCGLIAAVIYGWKFSPDARRIMTVKGHRTQS